MLILRRILALLLLVIPATAVADQVRVVYTQGAAHGFVEVTTLDGKRLAIGDLVRAVRGGLITSRLTIKFFDGSLDDETTLFTQNRVFRLIRDHHIQHGPSFPKPIDVTVDAAAGRVTSVDPNGRRTSKSFAMPADISNGLTLTVVMNALPTAAQTKISNLTESEKPRIVQLSIKNSGSASFKLGGLSRMASDYVIHVELGGVVGVVAPLVGKAPPDYHIWITSGADPAFIRETGPFFEGGPVWVIQQISASFPASQ